MLYESHLSKRKPRRHLHNYVPSAVGTADELKELLEEIVPSPGKVVVAAAANYAYRDLAMNFVWNLHRLNVTNYVLLAMDRAMFEFGKDCGIQTFYHDAIDASSHHIPMTKRGEVKSEEAVFGSRDFIYTSQLKSRLVLEILRLGYDVVFSDVDVFWLQNPIPLLVSYEEDIGIQSDAKFGTDQDPNYNINSGLYHVKASTSTCKVFGAIGKYGKKLRRSEQKAFNHVLCGAFREIVGGSGKRLGTQRCLYNKKGVTVTARTLPREAFPNGSDNFWTTTNDTGERDGVIAAHANYIQGHDNKVLAMKTHGFWLVDSLSYEHCERSR